VNITNIREAPRVHVQNTYVNIVNVTNITYINQTHGATAMRQDDFAAGRSVRNVAVRVDPREMQQARALQQPEVAAAPRAIVSRPVTRPVPVSIQRPVLINQQGKQIAARPGATPIAPPVRQEPQIRPLPGRTIVAAPAHPVPNRAGGNQFPASNPNPPANNAYQHQQGPQPVAPGVQPIGRPAPPTQNMQPDRPNNQQPNYQQQERPAPPPPQQKEIVPPQKPAYQPQERPAPPPPNRQTEEPKPRQDAAPPQPGKPQPNDQKQKSKDQKKDPKKDDKKQD
jgi:hypothetical protein